MQWLVNLNMHVINNKKLSEIQVFLLMLQFSSAMARLGNSSEEESDIVSGFFIFHIS